MGEWGMETWDHEEWRYGDMGSWGNGVWSLETSISVRMGMSVWKYWNVSLSL